MPRSAQPAPTPNLARTQVNVVYKFGGSSVRDAERMMEVADIVCSFPQYLPCVVLSAMGKVRAHACMREVADTPHIPHTRRAS